MTKKRRRKLRRDEIRQQFTDLEWEGMLKQFALATLKSRRSPALGAVAMKIIIEEAKRRASFESQDLLYLLEQDLRKRRGESKHE